MKRRTLLKRLAAVPFMMSVWPLFAALAKSSASVEPVMRHVRIGDPGWPTASRWDQLKQAVGGNLIPLPQPPLDWHSYTGETSGASLGNLENPYFVGDHPELTQISGWVDAWSSAPSAYAVAARNANDVAAAVKFARDNNVRLVVKGGGHSYQGTSSAADSLLIWTRAMHEIHLEPAFIPQGADTTATTQPAVTIEAGAMWMDAYNAVTTNGGRYVQGGGCATVGVAGLIQSGGFGSFSKRYGMAAASLLEAEVVTADGAVRTVNAWQNPDLFWAIKGGGGGSLGVITKVTLRTHDLPEWLGAARMRIKAASDAAYRALIERFLAFYSDSLFNPHWGESVSLNQNNTLNIGMVCEGLNPKEVEGTWLPFLAWVKASPSQYSFEKEPWMGAIAARSWWDPDYRKKNLPQSIVVDARPGAPVSHIWWKDNQIEVGLFLHGYESAWLPASLLHKDKQKHLVDALFDSSRHWSVELHFNKGLAGAPDAAIAAARDTAMNPAVLDAFTLVIIAGGEPAFPGFPGCEPDLHAARKAAHNISQAMNVLRKIVPNPGSYVSESNYFDRLWQQSFWGPNYPKLEAVKKKYDPDGLFVVHHGAGSERLVI